jgi:glycosyltransferase involved in cell wall biosynthesis
MSKQKSLSFFLPFRNEAGSLRATVDSILEAAHDCLGSFEIILVDDGSTDESPAIASQLTLDPHIRVITLDSHEGFGAAFLTGLKSAKFEYAMYLGADGDVYTEELREILTAWSGDRPLVQHILNDHERTVFRFVLSRFYTLLVGTLSGLRLPYFNGFNILPVETARQTDLNDFGFCTQAHALIRLLPFSSPPQIVGTYGRFHDQTSQSLNRRNFAQAFRFLKSLALEPTGLIDGSRIVK